MLGIESQLIQLISVYLEETTQPLCASSLLMIIIPNSHAVSLQMGETHRRWVLSLKYLFHKSCLVLLQPFHKILATLIGEINIPFADLSVSELVTPRFVRNQPFHLSWPVLSGLLPQFSHGGRQSLGSRTHEWRPAAQLSGVIGCAYCSQLQWPQDSSTHEEAWSNGVQIRELSGGEMPCLLSRISLKDTKTKETFSRIKYSPLLLIPRC